MNTLEGNKLIVEFMGYGFLPDSFGGKIPHYQDGYYFNPSFDESPIILKEAKYHSSWDWLRPVIDKIFTYSIAHPEEAGKVCNMKIIVNIDAAWEMVAKFIQWYNDNQIKRK